MQFLDGATGIYSSVIKQSDELATTPQASELQNYNNNNNNNNNNNSFIVKKKKEQERKNVGVCTIQNNYDDTGICNGWKPTDK